MILHQELLKTLHYEPATGELICLVQRGRLRAGQAAGTLHAKGYVYVMIKRHQYRAHRLIWFYMTKKWPAQEVDHRDRDRSNNRWNNLREATHGQNCANSKTRSRHGLKGVRYEKKSPKNPWIAQLRTGNELRYLGCFATKEEAHQAYCEEAQRVHGEFFNPV